MMSYHSHDDVTLHGKRDFVDIINVTNLNCRVHQKGDYLNG